jgi:uncharacterized protein
MPKFELYRDRIGGYRWRLKASNGEIVAVSESYVSLYGARQSIALLKQIVPMAMVVNV